MVNLKTTVFCLNYLINILLPIILKLIKLFLLFFKNIKDAKMYLIIFFLNRKINNKKVLLKLAFNQITNLFFVKKTYINTLYKILLNQDVGNIFEKK